MWSSARRRASQSLQVRAGGGVWAGLQAGRLPLSSVHCAAFAYTPPACLLFPSAAPGGPASLPRRRAAPSSRSHWALQRGQVQPHQHADGAQLAGHGLQDTRCAATAFPAAAGTAAAAAAMLLLLPAPPPLPLPRLLLLAMVCCPCSCLPVHCSASLLLRWLQLNTHLALAWCAHSSRPRAAEQQSKRLLTCPPLSPPPPYHRRPPTPTLSCPRQDAVH